MERRGIEFLSRFKRSKSDYLYCDGLTKSEWAWEFLRRNKHYHRAYTVSRARLSRVTILSNQVILMRPRGYQTGAEDWGLACFSDPIKTAHQTPVFWSKAILGQCAVANAAMAKDTSEQADLDIFRQTACVAILENKSGNNVLVRTSTNSIDLQISGMNILLNPTDLSFRIDGTSSMKRHAETLIELANALQNNSTFEVTPLSKSTRNNLLKALVALDCNQLNGSLQDTADGFRALGLTRLSWSVLGDESLKKQVIRARNRGLKLMQGDYRKLLS